MTIVEAIMKVLEKEQESLSAQSIYEQIIEAERLRSLQKMQFYL